ncbi:hypothetical protein DMN91_009927 [Ooceraea biroi]|uniref:Uncharacterized protein n=1 Tax=Ooceraea biroi TaxID=2015173 RepID=A0A3L8DBI7_OOCBI|nr:uncharacterized protein LOC105281528 [Ooceraea biroi]RLU17691.1 hypothetical protein DMN91_009927 [Ooceraea biroi]
MASLRLQSLVCPDASFTISAFIFPKLTGKIPAAQVACSSWNHLRDLSLADPEFATPGPIDIILGADIYGSLLHEAIRKGPHDAPVAQSTALGWIVSGPAAHATSEPTPVPRITLSTRADSELNDELQRFWLQEEVQPASRKHLTADELECEEHFRKTHSRNETGRYIVRFPFRANLGELENSRSVALRTLDRVSEQLRRNDTFRGLYVDFLREYASLGHMCPAPSDDDPTQRVVYLPHHGVLRESSNTTKLRVVFNGSAKTTTNLSLNDCLHTGPKLQQDLDAVLLRWRTYAFVFAADIEKMYRQILIHPDDRDYQRILWSESGALLIFLLCTVTYSLACSAFQAIRVLRQLADDEGHRFPLAAPVLLNSAYVDDVLSGADTPQLARDKANQVSQLLMAGGFKLQKWSTNDHTIIEDVTANHSTTTLEFDSEARTLGLTWNPDSDTFHFRFQPLDPSVTPTKRLILSRVAQLFDSLGWLSPITITGKIIIQRLWKAQVDWDEPLSDSLAQSWTELCHDLPCISSYSVPRWLHTLSTSVVELHGFSDASQNALGAVVYLRTFSEFDDAKVTLLAAKSKVAPIKKRSHASSSPPRVCLAWIRGQPCQWGEFVANRVALVQETVPDAHWHHVSGTDNPVDCASRGLLPHRLLLHSLWWYGPEWLQQPLVSWPSAVPPLDHSIDLELRRSSSFMTTTRRSVNSCWDLITQYSRLNRLLRITAWIRRGALRFKRTPCLTLSLTPEEIRSVERFWVHETQQAFFKPEIDLLSQGNPLPRANPLLKLAPFIDHEGLRISGRLKNSLLDSDSKHPVIHPRDCQLSALLIDDAHQRILHGGVQVTLANLRRCY